MKKNNFLTKAFALLFVLLFNLTGARAIVTHTVYANETETSTIVPVEGDVVGDRYIRSQFIIPKGEMQIMANGQITSIIFHAEETVVNWFGDAHFRVYFKEVDYETFSSDSYHSWSDLTEVYSTSNVYEGKLAINGHQLIITLDDPFLYSGTKNLLVGIYQTAQDTNGTSTFYGKKVTNGSIGGYSYSSGSDSYYGTIARQDFVPRTTFVYIPGFIPKNVNAVATKTNTEETIAGTHPEIVNATVTWTGTAEKYEVRYRTKRPLFSENFNSSQMPAGWTVRKGSDSYGNGWNLELKENSRTDRQMSSYSWHSGGGNQGTKYHADNWLISPAVELGGILKFDAILSAWHDIYEVRVSTTGIAEADFAGDENLVRPLSPGISGTEDFDLEKFQGQTGYIAIHHQNYDGYFFSVDNFELSSGHKWKKITEIPGTTKTVVLPRLVPYMEYEYVVVGIKTDPTTGQEVRGETVNLSFTCPGAADIILPDDEDNEDLIYDVAGLAASANHYKFNAYLENRSFVDNEIWNTLSLPFDVTVDGSPFEGALIYSVKDRSSVDNNNTLTLRIDPLDDTATLKAGTPYLITWEGAKGLTEPVFRQVTFTNETHPVIGSVAGGTTIAFKPNFDFLKYTAENKSILFLSNNHLYHVGVNSKIRPQRGYFEVSGGNGIKGISFVIDEEDPTAIESVNGAVDNNPWYDLNGRKLTGKPAQKGIYINNGKKTIIK